MALQCRNRDKRLTESRSISFALTERLDRLTHHVHVLEINGDSSRPKRSRNWKNNDGDSSSRNIKFVKADANRRNLHGLRKSILRSLNDFDGGLFARFIG